MGSGITSYLKVRMDTIAKHRKRLLQPYKREGAADEIIASATHLAQLVLSSEHILRRHKKKILSEVLWLVSEVDGKYSTRYRSARVIQLARDEPTSNEKIQHEHVFPRKKVTELLLDNPGRLETVLAETVGCVVTADEHRELVNSAEGWERYRHVKVLDMLSEPPTERPCL